jgi:hypothetical protein
MLLYGAADPPGRSKRRGFAKVMHDICRFPNRTGPKSTLNLAPFGSALKDFGDLRLDPIRRIKQKISANPAQSSVSLIKTENEAYG